MNLDVDQIETAARIAASKYFSNDNAVDNSDLVSIATLRILDRNPTTVGTAVHVGREGIMRELGYLRYVNASETINLSAVSQDSDCSGFIESRPIKARRSEAAKKFSKFIREMQKLLGNPIKLFSRYGIAYHEPRRDALARIPFDAVPEDTRFGDLLRLKIETSRITPKIKELAQRNYVLALIKPKRST